VESEVEDTPAWALSDQSGITLIWFKGDFRYELFLRVGVDPDLALEMAESARPLGNLIE
jgi:hypothetical protein